MAPVYKLGLTERIFYEYVRVFPFWYLRLNLLLMFLKSKLSEVIRAEAETSLLKHENKYLYVTFVFDEYQLFVLTKVLNIQTTMK